MEVRDLTADEEMARDEGLAMAAEFLECDLPLSPEQVQRLYDTIARDHAGNDNAQIPLGIAFGSMIARKSGFNWVRIIDEYGEETGLCHTDAAVVCFPISMLQKRISSDDAVDLTALCDATIATVNEAAATGNYPPR